MIKCTAPDGHNWTTEVFRRTSHEGSLCFGDDCNPIEYHKVTSYALYVVFVLTALASAAAIVHMLISPVHNVPVIEEYPVQARITPCGYGFATEWIDDVTIECIKETR